MEQPVESQDGWWEFQLNGPLPALEAFADFMAESGAGGAVFSEDPARPGAQMVTSFLPAKMTSPGLVELIRERAAFLAEEFAGAGGVALTLTRVEDRDWAKEWKDGLEPLWLHPGVWIVPSHRPVPEEAQGDPVIILDPGLAFGTGQHATTRMCVFATAEAVASGARSVLDLGCGTGVLAMTAARCGAERVRAADIDPVAVRVARENIALNGLEGRVEALAGFAEPEAADLGEKFDYIVANLFPEAIAGMLDLIARHLAPGGRAALSGIIAEREAEVASWMPASGLEVYESLEDEGWVTLLLKRCGDAS